MSNLIPDYDRTYKPIDEFHSVVTIELGELIKSGVIDFNDSSWYWDAYNDQQYARVCEKITNRFWHREISILPVGFWKKEFLRKMNEIMPKYKILYKRIDDGINPLQIEDDYGKSRNIISEFPETQLGENEDYASHGTDREYEHIKEGDVIKKINEFQKYYKDVDVLILEELEPLFSCLLTVNVNSLY